MAACTQFNSPIVPVLEIFSQIRIPEPSEGKDGREIQEILQDIFSRAEDIPSRVAKLEAIPQNKKVISQNNDALELLNSWREGDEIEQKDTWNYLKKALEENRLSSRKLFK